MSQDYVSMICEAASVASPVESPSAEDWTRLENALERPLPCDLKILISRLGNGHFGEFALLNPVSSSHYTRFDLQHVLGFQNVYGLPKTLKQRLYPAAGGLILIGEGSNGIALLLDYCKGNYQLILLEMDYEAYHVINATLSEFIWKLYSGGFSEKWAEELRGLVWGDQKSIFSSQPGVRS